MIAILSTGRCGTTFLSEVFNTIDICEISHQRKGSRIINILGNATVHHLFPHALLKKILIKFFGFNGAPDSTADPLRAIPLSFFILSSGKEHDEIKIIHLVRDPRDFVTSFMNWKKVSVKRTILHHAVPLWQPNPWLAKDVSFWERINMSKFEHFCWIWSYKNQLFKDNFSKKQNYFLIKFEDLVTGSARKEKWKELFDFLELPQIQVDKISFPEKIINKSNVNIFPDWQHWPSLKAVKLNYWCGDLMNELGYGNEKKWRELLNE